MGRTPLLLVCLVTAASCGKSKSPFTSPQAPPVAADPHLIEMSSETTTDLVPAGTPAELAIRIRVSASRVSSANRPPLDLVLLLDTSGSMEGKSIEALRLAAHDLVSRMSPHDHLGVVTFDSQARVVIPSAELTPDARIAALDKIDHLEARGTTDMSDGLALALQQVSAGRAAGSIDRIVMLGDGVPNDPAPIASLVDQARAARISITTLGLGLDIDEGLLGQIALETGGVYRAVDKPEAVADVFDHELTRMQTVVGRNLYLQLQPGPGVTIDDMPGLTPSGASRYAMLGDLASGETRDVIVPVHVTGHHDGATVELVDAVLTFDDAAGNSGSQKRDAFASAKASSDQDAVKNAVKAEIELARARAQAASAILQAIALARSGSLDPARKLLDGAEASARDAADKFGDPELRELVGEITEVRAHLQDLVQQQIVQPALNTPPPTNVDYAGGGPAAHDVVMPGGAGGSVPTPSPSTPTSAAPAATQEPMPMPSEADERMMIKAHADAVKVLDHR
jgi:Ca-activated chloride channel family protein